MNEWWSGVVEGNGEVTTRCEGKGGRSRGYTKVRWYIGFLLGVEQKKGSKSGRRGRTRRWKREGAKEGRDAEGGRSR